MPIIDRFPDYGSIVDSDLVEVWDSVTTEISGKEYWAAKISKNRKRDQIVTKYYQDIGWNGIRIWEHDVKLKVIDKSINSMLNNVYKKPVYGHINIKKI